MALQVETHAGYRGDEYPLRFRVLGRWIEVREILDRWLSPERRYFKVRSDDDCVYILCHDEGQGWDWQVFDSGRHPDTRLSSSGCGTGRRG